MYQAECSGARQPRRTWLRRAALQVAVATAVLSGSAVVSAGTPPTDPTTTTTTPTTTVADEDASTTTTSVDETTTTAVEPTTTATPTTATPVATSATPVAEDDLVFGPMAVVLNAISNVRVRQTATNAGATFQVDLDWGSRTRRRRATASR